MSVKVAFQKSDGSFIHKLICWWSQSEFAHCEVVVDGVGYGMKGSVNGLFIRDHHPLEQWELIAVDWPKHRAMKYMLGNKSVEYDLDATTAHAIPGKSEDPTKLNCCEWVVNTGSYCDDPRFHNLDASKFKPVDIYFKLTGVRK